MKPGQPGEAQAFSEVFDLFSIYENADQGASFVSDHDGANHGTEDAQHALAGAQAVRQPPGTPIYFSFDFNKGAVSGWPSATGPLQDYITAAANVVKPVYTVGVYKNSLERSNTSRDQLARSPHLW
jgi:Rv2525c-like, glycoside hydrolase-like domain